MLIYERLKASRSECKLTQQQVADILGVDRSTYAYYELGVSIPSIENLITLSNIFNVDFSWLSGADKPADKWNAPEGEIQTLFQVKSKNITELSKEERFIVALYRVAGRNGRKKELYETLLGIAREVSNE